MSGKAQIRQKLEIHDLVARFADLVNRKAMNEMHHLFTPDAVLDITGFQHIVGRNNIITFLTDILSLWSGIVQAVHSGTVELLPGTHPKQATGRWYLTEFGVKEGVDTYVGGVYSDDYVRTASGFRFTRRRFDLLYMRAGATVTAQAFPSDLP
ncbi:nuclear transport factor 2 family protein [Polyangium sp. 15x6]|uniref:nuclear transport factor 2 family protein n=1 Tax=Polyangium sp. 15x6 TaxID=3042687 RepID=UPI00249B6F96|nr:nuclear transport factor 2 family protein [Polyangium sp. 15x6]MDI3287303.1 nuclear transport factor 2 family protein [Polyangium sp. 15x6]